jgi:hypothetical protein
VETGRGQRSKLLSRLGWDLTFLRDAGALSGSAIGAKYLPKMTNRPPAPAWHRSCGDLARLDQDMRFWEGNGVP